MIFKASSIASPPGPGPSLYSHACVRKEKNILEIMSTWCQFWLGMHGTGSKIIHLMRPQIEFVEPKTGWSTALNPRFTSNGGWVFKSLCYVQVNLYGGSYHGLAMWGAECKHTAKAIMFGKATNWRVGLIWLMDEGDFSFCTMPTQSSQLTDILMVSLPGDAHGMIPPSRAPVCLAWKRVKVE